MTEVIYGDVKYQVTKPTTVESVNAFASAYLVNATEEMRDKAKLWEKEYIRIVSNYTENSKWIKISYSSEVLPSLSISNGESRSLLTSQYIIIEIIAG